MSGLVLIVHYVDGTSRAVRSERDTLLGRRQLDKAALLMLAADDVTRCEVTHRAEGARPKRRTYR